MKKLRNYILLFFGLALFLGACSAISPGDEAEESANDSDQIQVIASIFPVYEVTQAITGDEANVSLMVGANEDAHHYEPSAQAIAALNEADIFVYSSDAMEFWVKSLLEVVENEDLNVIKMAEGLDLTLEGTEEDLHHEHGAEEHAHNHGGVDPHFWVDPVAVSQQIPVITEALSQADPENSILYEENATAFTDELSTLHRSYEQAFNDVDNNVFVVQHQAFGHLANRYGLNQVAVGGLTTEIEPSPQQMADIIDFVKAQNVPVIYYQSGENSAVAETIADETGTKIAVLHDLESEPAGLDEAGNRYIEAMYENLEQLKLSIN